MKDANKKEMTLDDLARIVQEGFLSIDGKLGTIEADVSVLKTDVAELKSDVRDIKADLNKKADKIDHNTLTYRVEKLEKKFA
jgi:uncharacterized protein YoxC